MTNFIEDEFFGLHIFPRKSYTQTVEKPFRITMAALSNKLESNKRSCVMVRVNDDEYVLCSLTPEKLEQQLLNHSFLTGENVTFYTDGENPVHLTGSFLSIENDEYDEGYPIDLGEDDSNYENTDDELLEDEEITSEEDEEDEDEDEIDQLDSDGEPKVQEITSDEEKLLKSEVSKKIKKLTGKSPVAEASSDEDDDEDSDADVDDEDDDSMADFIDDDEEEDDEDDDDSDFDSEDFDDDNENEDSEDEFDQDESDVSSSEEESEPVVNANNKRHPISVKQGNVNVNKKQKMESPVANNKEGKENNKKDINMSMAPAATTNKSQNAAVASNDTKSSVQGTPKSAPKNTAETPKQTPQNKAMETPKSKAQQEKQSQKSTDNGTKAVAVNKTPASPTTTSSISNNQTPKNDQKTENKESSNTAASTPSSALKKKTLPSGLVIEDMKLGDEKSMKAKAGRKVSIVYKGYLDNGKVFDSNSASNPLEFTVGAGEVIKGLDMGILQMAKGGTRVIKIPAALAYGNKDMAKIPKNSNLTFEVTVENVKN